MKKTILAGFSLIEILVSLIIISLITAAFVPVITKKLSISSMVLNGSISGGGSGNNSGGNHTGNNTLPSLIKSQEDCDKIANSLVFLSQEQNGGKAACVTKANVGDTYRYGPEISSATGVTIVNSGASCGSGDDSKCCWLGNNGESTSNYCEDSGNGDSTYSGCKRTVCTWAAAKSVCENWEPVEGTKGKWRLPKNEELAAWGRSISAINRNQGFAGLQLCDRYSGYGSVQCMGYKACLGTTDGMCNPLYVWSGTEASSNQARYYYLQSGNFSADYDSINRAFSARCVLDEDSWKETTGATEPKDPDQEIPDSNKPFYGSLPTDITSQSDCDKLARNLYFISAENNGGVAACVTKANVGDTYMYGPEISVAADVSVVNASNSTNNIKKACYLGNNVEQTSNLCSDNNGGYSGCKRTVCTWEAANAACENWAPTDETKGYWRLPSIDEIQAWDLSKISDGKGTDGLQFCSRDKTTNSAQCGHSSSTGVYPEKVWSISDYENQYRGKYYLYFTNSYGIYYEYGSNGANSARCMIDSITIRNINKKLNGNFTLPSQIASQNDCDKMGINLLYIPSEDNLGDAACITRANMGDTYAFGYEIPSSAGITVVDQSVSCGSSEDYTTKCCWTGETGYGNDIIQVNSNYSGKKRTVCNWNAANSICANFEPVAKTKGRWRTPTYDEVGKWDSKKLILNKTTNNLQLCYKESYSNDDYSGNEHNYMPSCYENSFWHCEGSYYYQSTYNGIYTSCQPAYIWLNENSNQKFASRYSYGYGGRETVEKTRTASTRCMITDSNVRAIHNLGNLPNTISSQADCNKLGRNLMYLTAEQNGGVAACVIKFNLGDTYIGGYEIDKAAGVNYAELGYSGNSLSCFNGNNIGDTSGSSCSITGNGNSTYSGCRRTVCAFSAADKGCQYLETVAGTKGYWRLPNSNEVKSWEKHLSEIQLNKGTNGLQLCDSGNNIQGSVYCSGRYYNLGPSNFWTKDTISDSSYTKGCLTLYSNSFSTRSCDVNTNYAYSVRCVLDQTALTKIKNWEAP